MIRLKSLIESIELLPDGNLKIPNINDITQSQWEQINHIMVQKGYNMRGPDDCKRAILKFLDNPNNNAPDVIRYDIYDAWVDTIATVLHLNRTTTPIKKMYDPKNVITKALRKFGHTSNISHAGYILPTGALLNFSSGHGAARDQDHREIANLYIDLGIKIPNADSGTDYMHAFMRDCGAIRIGGSQGFADLWREPTRQQATELLKFFSMFEGKILLEVNSTEYGNAYQQYNRGTSPQKILRDIVTFYHEGIFPNPLSEGITLDELIVKNLSKTKNDGKFVLAFRQYLFIMDDNSDIKKIKRVLRKHPGYKDADDTTNDNAGILSSMSKLAPDILIGIWYANDKNLNVWRQGGIEPSTSIQVKKVAKQLGVKTISYEYMDFSRECGESEKEIPAKRLKGRIPDVMFHGTSTLALQSLLTYGLDPRRGNPQFGRRGIYHPDHVFMAATFEEALFYCDNAVEIDRADKRGESFPIIIEFKVPDPALLVPDFDADTTAGSTPYYRHPVKSHTVTAMKAMGVSRETGKWGYKGRVPASFFKWVYYYNPYLKKWKKSNPDVWQRLLDKYDIDIISWKLGLQGYRADNYA